MKKTVIFVLGLFLSFGLLAQKITPEQYIATYKDLAMREMIRMGVPAAITLAQGLLETESGNSDLLRKSNNHFGIKCKSTWTSKGVSHDDDTLGECFRSYASAEESYRDHSNFLRGSDRYLPLFRLNPLDYKAWAYGLKKAGYATNPKYPQILINNIEQYNLQQYSILAAKQMTGFDASNYTDDPDVMVDSSAVADTAVKATSKYCNKPPVPVQTAYVDTKTASIVYYTVQPKEGLYSISKKFGVTIDQLKDWNNLPTDSVQIGQQLIVQKP
jgi:hypothetical protein